MRRKSTKSENNELQELLGRMPGWAARWGSTMVLLLFCALIFGSWMIHYPEIIQSRLVIITVNPPVSVVAKCDGRLQKLFVSDNQRVSKGDVLALIENMAKYDDVIKLKSLLDSIHFNKSNPDSILMIDFFEDLNVGDIQYSYTQFLKAYDAFRSFSKLNYSERLILSLNLQIADYQNQLKQQERKIYLLQEELKIAEKQKERNKVLFEKGIISKNAFEKYEAQVIEKQYNIEEAQAQLGNLKLKIAEIEQRKLDIDLTGKDNRNQYFSSLLLAGQNLESEIEKWIQTYLLKAPQDGIVTFTNYWHENQNVVNGHTVFKIVPENQEKITGKLVIPMSGAGKVKAGQKVNVKFDSYPFQKYGIVKAELIKISLVPEQNVYVAEVGFPNGLKTTYNKELMLRQEMTATAEIITEDLRLFERFFYPLRSFFKEKFNT